MAVPSQFILQRTSTRISNHGAVEARFTVALPAKGRSIEGRWAAQLLCTRLFDLGSQALLDVAADIKAVDSLTHHVNSVLDQQHLRSQLAENKLVAFIGDGAILPRRAGNDDRPMLQDAEPFDTTHDLFFDQKEDDKENIPMSDDDTAVKKQKVEEESALRVKLTERRSKKEIWGLGLPEGVSLICGGGFHGKSTVLAALAVGGYDKIPGDGRELCVTVKEMAKIRAEDGRAVNRVDVSAFIGALPGSKIGTNKDFSTQDASGSTSQAAAVAEAVEAGASCLLFDEDTCATNFMIRDARMRQLVADEAEPITPFVDRITDLRLKHNVSGVLVIGGTGDYFAVADAVVVMRDYKPIDATSRARSLAGKPDQPQNLPSAYFTPRIFKAVAPEGRYAVKGMRTVSFGDNNDVDLSALDQIIEVQQTHAILAALVHFNMPSPSTMGFSNQVNWPRPVPDGTSFASALDALEKDLDGADLDLLATAHGGIAGDLARPRRLDIAAAFNRLRNANFIPYSSSSSSSS